MEGNGTRGVFSGPGGCRSGKVKKKYIDLSSSFESLATSTSEGGLDIRGRVEGGGGLRLTSQREGGIRVRFMYMQYTHKNVCIYMSYTTMVIIKVRTSNHMTIYAVTPQINLFL